MMGVIANIGGIWAGEEHFGSYWRCGGCFVELVGSDDRTELVET